MEKTLKTFMLKQNENLLNDAYFGNETAIKDALANGADPNTSNVAGWTPLQMSAAHGFVNIVATLLGNGAATEMKNKFGQTALLAGALYGNLDTCGLLLASGADVMATDCDGNTALHLAAMTNHKKLYQFLLGQGADDRVKNNKDKTPRQLLEGFSEFAEEHS